LTLQNTFNQKKLLNLLDKNGYASSEDVRACLEMLERNKWDVNIVKLQLELDEITNQEIISEELSLDVSNLIDYKLTTLKEPLLSDKEKLDRLVSLLKDLSRLKHLEVYTDIENTVKTINSLS
jgi:hypothetical protein